MDQGSSRLHIDSLADDMSSSTLRHEEKWAQHAQNGGGSNDESRNNDACGKRDEKGGKDSSPLDVSEVLRRWTHALQRIHKQAVRLVLN